MKYIYLLAFQCTLLIAKAQPLSELTTLALTQNLNLKITNNEYRTALERAPQISQLPQPELGIGVFPLPIQTRLGAQVMRFSATQQLPWIGTLKSQAQLANTQAQLYTEQFRQQQLQIIQNLEENYIQLHNIREQQRIQQRRLNLLERLQQLATTQLESGQANAANVLERQLQAIEVRQLLRVLEAEEVLPVSTINQLLHRKLSMPITVTDTFQFAEWTYETTALLDSIQRNHPALNIYQIQQNIAQNKLTINDLSNKPTLGVGLDYFFINERTDALFSDNGRDALQLRATVKVPIYQKRYQAKSREEQLTILRLEDQREQALEQFETFILQTRAAYEQAQLKWNLYQQQQQVISSSIRLLEADFSSGQIGLDALLELELRLLDYELKVLDVIVESQILVSRMRTLIF